MDKKAKIETLIDKQDHHEIIRDQVAAILAIEIANQKALAVVAGKANPDLWNFAVTVEKANPFEALENQTGEETGILKNGLVNVFFDGDDLKKEGSDYIGRQSCSGTFIIDCYGFKNTTTDGSEITGYGDELASREAERVARLARNILMSAHYTYLRLGADTGADIVHSRYVTRREKFAPAQSSLALENVVGARLTLTVDYYEHSPQEKLGEIETLMVQCTRSDDGFVYFTNEI